MFASSGRVTPPHIQAVMSHSAHRCNDHGDQRYAGRWNIDNRSGHATSLVLALAPYRKGCVAGTFAAGPWSARVDRRKPCRLRKTQSITIASLA